MATDSENWALDDHVADVLRDVWDSFRDNREGFIDYLLDPNRSGLRVEVADA